MRVALLQCNRAANHLCKSVIDTLECEYEEVIAFISDNSASTRSLEFSKGALYGMKLVAYALGYKFEEEKGMDKKRFKMMPTNIEASPLDENSRKFMAEDYALAYKRVSDCVDAGITLRSEYYKGRLEGLSMAAVNLGYKFVEVDADAR